MYPLAVARCSQLHRLSTGDIGSRLLGSYAITLFGAAASWARDARLVQDSIPKDDPQFVRCVQVMLTTKTEQAPALAWRHTHVLIVLKAAGCPDHVGAGQGDFNATDTLLFADACPAGAFLDRDLICFDGPSDPKLIALYGRFDHLGQDLRQPRRDHFFPFCSAPSPCQTRCHGARLRSQCWPAPGHLEKEA